MSFLHPTPDAAHPLRGSHAAPEWWIVLLLLLLGLWELRYVLRSLRSGWLRVRTLRSERKREPLKYWTYLVLGLVTGTLLTVGSILALIQLAGRWWVAHTTS